MVTDYESLEAELARVREMSVVRAAAAGKDPDRVLVGYASPLFRHGECVGALGIARRESVADRESEALLCHVLQQGAKEICRRLAYE